MPTIPPAVPAALAFALAGLLLPLSAAVAQPAAANAAAAAAPQDPVAVVPPELSDEARKAYMLGIKEVRELIAARQFVAAEARVDALLAQRPREAQARFLKGVLQTERGDDAGAIATFLALTEDYPELPEPYNNVAVLYAQKGNLGAARTALQSALIAAPDWALAHENLGDVYARMAAVEYDRAATLDRAGKSAAAKLTLARALLAAK